MPRRSRSRLRLLPALFSSFLLLTPALPASADLNPWENLESELKNAPTNGTVRVTENITSDIGSFIVTSKSGITFDGGGHTLTLQAGSNIIFSSSLGSVVNLNIIGASRIGALRITGALTNGIAGSTFSGSQVETHGGAIYVTQDFSGGITGSTFNGNQASTHGGAVFVNQGFSGDITGSTFSDNQADGNGGAVYVTQDFSGGITGSTFSGNQAGGDGGAVYVYRDFSGGITGSTFSYNEAGGHGGALYLNRGMADGAAIGRAAFLGNKAGNPGGAIYSQGNLTLAPEAGETTLFTGNTANGLADSIYLDAQDGYPVELRVSPQAGGLVDMRDPFSGLAGDLGDFVNITLDGPGTWKLAGDNRVSGNGSSRFTVSRGTLYLYAANEAVNGAASTKAGQISLNTLTDSSFTLKKGATLALGGSANSIKADTITFETGATLAFDLANDARLNLEQKPRPSEAYSGLKIDILSLAQLDDGKTESFCLAYGGNFFSRDHVLTLRGEDTNGTRADGLLSLSGDTKALWLTQLAAKKESVTWTNGGGDGLWNIKSANWENSLSGGPVVTQFLHGDDVTFDSGASGTVVSVNAGGVVTGDLTFDQADGLELTGGAITASGTVNVNGGAVDFTGLTGDNEFKGKANGKAENLQITGGGKLTVAGERQLGTSLSGLVLDDGTLVIKGPASFQTAGNSDQRLLVQNGLNRLELQGSSAQAVISGNRSSSGVHGGAMLISTNSELVQTAEGGASLTFQDNAADFGGAVANWGTLTLTNASFYNNTAAYYVGGHVSNTRVQNHPGGDRWPDRHFQRQPGERHRQLHLSGRRHKPGHILDHQHRSRDGSGYARPDGRRGQQRLDHRYRKKWPGHLEAGRGQHL